MSLLSDELTNDPLSIGYSGMTDAQAAASLNNLVYRGAVATDSVVEYLALQGKWSPIADAVWHETISTNKRLAARTLVDITQRYQTLDMSVTLRYNAMSAALDDLVSHSLISTTDKAALLSLGENVQSRAAVLGIPYVFWHDVQRARA